VLAGKYLESKGDQIRERGELVIVLIDEYPLDVRPGDRKEVTGWPSCGASVRLLAGDSAQNKLLFD